MASAKKAVLLVALVSVVLVVVVVGVCIMETVGVSMWERGRSGTPPVGREWGGYVVPEFTYNNKAFIHKCTSSILILARANLLPGGRDLSKPTLQGLTHSARGRR